MREQELIDRHIHPHHKVVVVGAYASPFEDPSVGYIGTVLAQGKRETKKPLTLVDFQTCYHAQRFEATHYLKTRIKHARDPTCRSVGDPIYYRRSLQLLKKKYPELQIVLPKIHLADAMELKPGELEADVVLDRGTHHFILSRFQNKSRQEQEAAAQKLLGNYASVAKKIILMFREKKRLRSNV